MWKNKLFWNIAFVLGGFIFVEIKKFFHAWKHSLIFTWEGMVKGDINFFVAFIMFAGSPYLALGGYVLKKVHNLEQFLRRKK